MIGKLIKGLKIVLNDIQRVAVREMRFYQVMPNAAILFLTYRCNSQCKTCSMWKLPAQETKNKEIAFAEWKIIIDKLYDAGIRGVEVFGGNVLLRKELLIQVLRYLKEKCFVIHLPTNQIGLDDDIASAIVECVDAVYISTDGIGEYQDAIRGQKGASQRSENAITRFLRLRKNNKSPRLICNTTVSKYNVDILEKLVQYAIAHCFDEIHFEYSGEFTQEHIKNSFIDGLKPAPYFIRQDESILVDQSGAKLLKESLRQIKEKYMNEGIKISTINIDTLTERNLYEGTIPHSKCYTERNEVTVDPTGNLIICPFINNYIIGNILNSPFHEVWNNHKHKRFRELQNKGCIEMCEHCILGVQRNPGILMSLKRIYLTRLNGYLKRYA